MGIVFFPIIIIRNFYCDLLYTNRTFSFLRDIYTLRTTYYIPIIFLLYSFTTLYLAY